MNSSTRAFFVATAVLLMSCGQFAKTESAHTQIINGTVPTLDNPVLWHSVALTPNIGMTLKFTTCSGTIVGPNAILTAKHCLMNLRSHRPGWKIIAGFGLQGEYVSRELESFVLHPSGDLAIAKISTPFPEFYQPAQLVDNSTMYQIGQRLVVAGYGRVGNNIFSTGVLRFGTMGFAGEKTLNKEISLQSKIGEADTCNFDSGGPVFVQHSATVVRLAGLTSNGPECGKGMPSFFVDVRYYLDWIAENIK